MEAAMEEPSETRRRRSPASRASGATVMDEGDLEGILALEELDVESVPEPEPAPEPPVQMQQQIDPLMSKAKPLPKKL